MQTYIPTCLPTYLPTFTYLPANLCLFIYMHASIPAYVHSYTSFYKHIETYMYIFLDTYADTYICITIYGEVLPTSPWPMVIPLIPTHFDSPGPSVACGVVRACPPVFCAAPPVMWCGGFGLFNPLVP